MLKGESLPLLTDMAMVFYGGFWLASIADGVSLCCGKRVSWGLWATRRVQALARACRGGAVLGSRILAKH